VALAMAVNLTRADAATRAIPFVRRTRGEAGVLVLPEALTRCVRFARVSIPILPSCPPFAFACGAESVFWGDGLVH
jgi:hypothetical protein